MFSTKQQQQSSEPASKNVSAWESLILDLESHGDDDDDDEEGGWFLNGGASSSLQLSARSGNGEEKMEQESEERLPQLLTNIHRDNSAAAANASNDRGEQQTSPTLESPSQLKDWMAYQSTNTKYAPHSNHMGRKMDAAYSLKAAQIALSLAKYLGRQFEQENDAKNSIEDLPSISCEDIVVDNVIVTNVDSGEAVSAALESTSSTSTSGATNHRSGGNTERRQVLALGMIMYELFTQGNPPPQRIQQSLKSSASASALSFSTSLRISEQSEEDDDRGASGGDRRKNKDDDDDNDMDESDQQELFVRKQRLRRCDDEKGKEQSISKLLKLAGVPISVGRLISDMISNRDGNDIGGLFQCDKSVSSFAEVIMDLEQMVDRPKDFLYDTIRLNAKPIVRNKLYSRQKELEQGIKLAGRCVMDVSSSVKQEVLMISGLSGEQLTGLCLFCRVLYLLLTYSCCLFPLMQGAVRAAW